MSQSRSFAIEVLIVSFDHWQIFCCRFSACPANFLSGWAAERFRFLGQLIRNCLDIDIEILLKELSNFDVFVIASQSICSSWTVNVHINSSMKSQVSINSQTIVSNSAVKLETYECPWVDQPICCQQVSTANSTKVESIQELENRIESFRPALEIIPGSWSQQVGKQIRVGVKAYCSSTDHISERINTK